VVIVVFFQACARKMSVEEARQVTVSMSNGSFVPPNRNIEDMLAFLEKTNFKKQKEINEIIKTANSTPPANETEKSLAKFYAKRGTAAHNLGLFNLAMSDIRLSIQYADRAGIQPADLMSLLGYYEGWIGNYRNAIETAEKALELKSDRIGNYRRLIELYLKVGKIDSAQKLSQKGISLVRRDLNPNHPWARYHAAEVAGIKSSLLEAKGNYLAAEPLRREAHKKFEEFSSSRDFKNLVKRAGFYPYWAQTARIKLANNLTEQDRIIEAELEIRKCIIELAELFGKESPIVGDSLALLGKTLLEQGRIEDTEKLLRTSIKIFQSSDIFSGSLAMASVKMLLGKILMVKTDFSGAMREFDSLKDNMKDNQFLYKNIFIRNPSIIICLLKTGRINEGMEFISSAYDFNRKAFGEDHYLSAELLGMRGIAYSKINNNSQAYRDFSNAIPILFKTYESSKRNYLKYYRLKVVVESYLDFLWQIRKYRLEKELGIDVTLESFKFIDILHGSSVYNALSASAARISADNTGLADLIRKEQDALKQINVIQAILSDTITVSDDQKIPGVVEDLKDRLINLNNARNTLLTEIYNRFPKYSELTRFSRSNASETQKYIKPSEALISIYPADNRTYIWGIPYKGKTQFISIDLDKKRLEEMISSLRRSLTPDPEVLGDIINFDINLAYDLYDKLLKPVKENWKGAKNLIIIASGPLGQLPFSILPTSKSNFQNTKGMLFSEYRQVPWLIRKVSITRLPSVSSFTKLRVLPIGILTRKAFVGFGDPLFNEAQLAEAEKRTRDSSMTLAIRGRQIQIRGIRISEIGTLDDNKITSCKISDLNRLPDTATEITHIANTLGANSSNDIFLGKNAAEHKVKTMDLSDRKVVAFATHALVSGDLDGLDQPALALSSPIVTKDREDGLLTMGEIMQLKLNADWVVLSACNTGAADGKGAEAISGLGHAFFYAGSRALMVSMWPVETTSAAKLTTSLFKHQMEDPTLSRAQALRKSMLDLLDSTKMMDSETGKVVATYAHPLFWAPFIIVGDSGLN
jgi:CHAT domain-containing protein